MTHVRHHVYDFRACGMCFVHCQLCCPRPLYKRMMAHCVAIASIIIQLSAYSVASLAEETRPSLQPQVRPFVGPDRRLQQFLVHLLLVLNGAIVRVLALHVLANVEIQQLENGAIASQLRHEVGVTVARTNCDRHGYGELQVRDAGASCKHGIFEVVVQECLCARHTAET